MNVIIIKGGEYGKPNSAYSQLKGALEKFFDVEGLVDALENQPPEFKRSTMRRSGSLRRGLARTTTGVSGISDIVGEDNGTRPGGYGLVIDGASLRHAFEEEFTKDLLLELGTRCKAVICCRTSPLQKALIVKLVKEGLGAMCLAIGDGANDVSMIQAADIGVGVAGEEGLQAVNSSDYAIGQFRYLNRLLLVHGHWSYMRNSSMIVNFFYKEIIGIGVLFWFQFYCGYSSTTVYEYTYLLFYNVFWTLGESLSSILRNLSLIMFLLQFPSSPLESSIATSATTFSWPSLSSTASDAQGNSLVCTASESTCSTESTKSVPVLSSCASDHVLMRLHSRSPPSSTSSSSTLTTLRRRAQMDTTLACTSSR
jgi:hypothetical protein